jgi:hypothetical protein
MGAGVAPLPPGDPALEHPPAPQPDLSGLSWWQRRRWRRAQAKRYLQECAVGFPEEFNEWPLGYALYAHAQTQITNAAAAQLIFNHFDFVDGSDQLNVRGRDKLAKITAELPTHFFPVIVERTPRTPGLDQTRRLAILSQLARGPFPVPGERVLIGPAIANGLNGQEGVLVYLNLIRQTASGGYAGGFGAPVAGAGFDSSGQLGGASNVAGTGNP